MIKTLVVVETQHQPQNDGASDLSGIWYENQVSIGEAHASSRNKLWQPDDEEDTQESEDQYIEEHANRKLHRPWHVHESSKGDANCRKHKAFENGSHKLQSAWCKMLTFFR